MATQKCFHVLMFPWLAHGHISPFLELARKLIEKGNFFIYFCSTPINLISIEKKLSDDDHQNYTKSIQLVEHNLPTLPELPPHYHTTNGLPPNLNSTLRKAMEMSKLTFSNTLNTLKPDLLICDDVFQWPEIVASSHDVPVVRFETCSVTAASFLTHTFTNPDDKYPLPAIYLHEYEIDPIRRAVDAVFGSGREESRNLLLIKTSKAIEEKYLDYYSLQGNIKIMPVGPLIIQQAPNDEDMKVIEWLDKKDPCSTVFVSFGTEYFMQKEEIEEMAQGLELSNVNFIWVVRVPVGAEKVELPSGFVERVGGRGIVVEGWAPQARILGHSSIGGFVSHCGWNSILESINFGVPIIGMPMKFEQPMNARLVSELGVCVEIVRRDKNRRFGREEVGNVIREVVGGKMGNDLRRNVKELGAKMKEEEEEEMDDVLDELVQICNKKKRTVV